MLSPAKLLTLKFIIKMLDFTLETLGLNKTEVKIYLAILKVGTTPASILGQRLKIPRSTAKYTCQQLLSKGLLTALNKNGSVFYTAKNPENLQQLIDKEREEIEQKETQLNLVLGDLKSIYNPHLVLPKVNYFEGVDGITTMLEDVLKEKQPLYGALYLDQHINPIIDDFLKNHYIPKRKRLHFPAWMMFNDNVTTQEYRKQDGEMNRISLLVPEKDYPFDICFHIYGDKIAFYSYRRGDLTGVIVQGTHIRTAQFSLFKLAWNFARTLKVNESYRKVELT